MSKWYIENDDLVIALRDNGFICERPKREPSSATISFHLNPNAEGNRRWFETNCPVRANASYTLPDGRVVKSIGTQLKLATALRKPRQGK